jgi:hypothetical protein
MKLMSQKRVATTGMASQKKMEAVKGASEMSGELTCMLSHDFVKVDRCPRLNFTKCMISLSTRTSD